MREFKIELNDHWAWQSDKARARGLRALAVAQLGSAGVVSKRDFSRQLIKLDSSLNEWEKREMAYRPYNILYFRQLKEKDLFNIANIAVTALRNLESPGVKLWDALVKDGVA